MLSSLSLGSSEGRGSVSTTPKRVGPGGSGSGCGGVVTATPFSSPTAPRLSKPDPSTTSDLISSLGTMSPLLSNKSFSQRERSLSWGNHHSSAVSGLALPSFLGAPASPTLSASTSTIPSLSGLGGPLSLSAASSVSSSVLPFAPTNTTSSTQQQSVLKLAMETAMQKERQRRLEKESKETALTAAELRLVLREERIRMTRMAAELAALKSQAVASQVEAEVHEEGRINHIMRRLEGLSKEQQLQKQQKQQQQQQQQQQPSSQNLSHTDAEIAKCTLRMKLDQAQLENDQLESQVEKESGVGGGTAIRSNLTTKLDDVPPLEEDEDEEECNDDDLVDLAAEAEKRDLSTE